MLSEKFKIALFSLLPLVGVFIAFHFFVTPFEGDVFQQWSVGCALLAVGLALFLTGAEVGLVPFGLAVGGALPHSRKVPLVLIIAFTLGVAAAYADPSMHGMGALAQAVVATPVSGFFTEASAFGIGFFSLVGIGRILCKIPLKKLLLVCYPALFMLCWVVLDKAFLPLVFASGAGATGPVVVALLMSLGLGVTATAKVSLGNSASFGLVGLLSLGVIAVMALMLHGARPLEFGAALPSIVSSQNLLPYYMSLVVSYVQRVALVMVPLAGLFLVFNALFLKLPGLKARRMALGIFYATMGMAFIMAGVIGGVVPGGSFMGEALGRTMNKGFIIGFCALLGAVCVYLEPAVWVWATQVATALGGSMKRLILVSLLCLSGGLGVGLGMGTILYELNAWWLLLGGYGLALALMFRSPRLYIGIAFDAGGVVTGPMCLFFLLTVVTGLCQIVFGFVPVQVCAVIAFTAMVPFIVIQLFGLMFMRSEGQCLIQSSAPE